MSKEFLNKFVKVCYSSCQASWTSHSNCWIAHSNEFVKANFDVVLFDDQNCLGVGVVILDLRGDFLVGFFKWARILLDVQMTKAYVLCRVIKLAMDRDLFHSTLRVIAFLSLMR